MSIRSFVGFEKVVFDEGLPVINGEGLSLSPAGKYLCPDQCAPGYEFKIVVDGEDAGLATAFIATDEGLVGELGNFGVKVERKFWGQNIPTKTARALLPFFRDNGMSSILITCDHGNAAIHKACEQLSAEFAGTLETSDPGLKKDRFVLKF